MCSIKRGAEPAAVDVAAVERAGELVRAIGGRVLDATVDDAGLQASVTALHRLESIVHAEKLRRIAALDERQAHVGQARSTVELLAGELGVTRTEARQAADTARALQRMPRTAERARAGDLGPTAAREAATQLDELDRMKVTGAVTGRQVDSQLDEVVAAQAGKDRGQVRRAVQTWLSHQAPQALADRERRAWRRRHASIWHKADGGWRIQGDLDEVGGAHVAAALGALARPADKGDERESAQRVADALVELARRSLDAGDLPTVALQRPHVLMVTTDDGVDGVAGAAPSVLDGVGPVSTATARMLVCDGHITEVVVDERGRPLQVRETGRPTRRQRLAVVARDKACIGCGAPAAWCQLHHIVWRRHRGATVVDNLTLVCQACHTNIHHFGWTVQRTAGGGFAARPPDRARSDPPAPPRRGGPHRVAEGDDGRLALRHTA